VDVSPRLELKYAISEALAHQIRDWLRPAFSLDPHADPATGRYSVNNLYFDTPDRRLYADTKLRKLRRFKLRLRYYGVRPEDLLVLEVKQRHNNVGWKRRQPAHPDDWPTLLHEPAEAGSLADLVTLCGAEPVLQVRYVREPWVSDLDDYGRVTFDRSLRYRLCHGSHTLAQDEGTLIHYDDPVSARTPDSPVVLEIKTEPQVPAWALALVRRFGLVQRGFSKYCYALDRCREAWAGVDRVPAR